MPQTAVPTDPFDFEELTDVRQRFQRWVLMFPSLRDAEGAYPFESLRFAQWAGRQEFGSGQLYAAQFVLAVWNGNGNAHAWFNQPPYELGQFDVIFAMAHWDAAHCRAFRHWIDDPFWP